MTAEFFAQSSDAAKVLLWPVRSSSSALPGGAKGAFTMAVLRRRAAGRSETSSRSGHYLPRRSTNPRRDKAQQNDGIEII